MLEQLNQMKEISDALLDAANAGDIDRVVALLKRRQELSDSMPKVDPNDPEVKSGKVTEMLKTIVELDGEIEGKIRTIMGTLQSAIKAVQGEQQVVKGYLKQTDESDPEIIDREG